MVSPPCGVKTSDDLAPALPNPMRWGFFTGGVPADQRSTLRTLRRAHAWRILTRALRDEVPSVCPNEISTCYRADLIEKYTPTRTSAVATNIQPLMSAPFHRWAIPSARTTAAWTCSKSEPATLCQRSPSETPGGSSPSGLPTYLQVLFFAPSPDFFRAFCLATRRGRVDRSSVSAQPTARPGERDSADPKLNC
jgi:hypothetical protein